MWGISIVIPVFNRKELLIETLKSVQAQSELSWECILVDDGSTDGSYEILKQYETQDSRFRVLIRPKELQAGGNAARNLGLQAAKSEWVMFLDSDDLLNNHAVKGRKLDILKWPNLDFYVYPAENFIEKPGDLGIPFNTINHQKDDLDTFIGKGHPWHTNGVVWNRAFLQKIGGWNEPLKCWQDWELHIRAITGNGRYIKVFDRGPDNYTRQGNNGKMSSFHDTASYRRDAFKSICAVEKCLINHSPELLPRLYRVTFKSILLENQWHNGPWASFSILFIRPFLQGLSRVEYLKKWMLLQFSDRPNARKMFPKRTRERMKNLSNEILNIEAI